MKNILVSFFVLFVTFSCAPPKALVSFNGFEVKIEEELTLSTKLTFSDKVKKNDLALYELGYIYVVNPVNELSLDNFKISDSVIKVKGEHNLEDLSYSFNDLTLFDYVLNIKARAYAITNKDRVIYSKDIISFTPYQEALKSDSNYAKSIVSLVEDSISDNDGFDLTLNLDEKINGFNVLAEFNGFEDDNVYGILFKYNASVSEQQSLDFLSSNYVVFFSSVLEEGSLKVNFKDILEENYFEDITIRSFSYNALEKTFIFNDKTITSTVYHLALEDNSDYGKDIIKTVEKNFIVISEIFINTDEEKDYTVGSYSEGITVTMETDYNYVWLHVNAKKGYRFSNNLDILIKRVNDNVIVDKFTTEVQAFKILITYDDYGWGPSY